MTRKFCDCCRKEFEDMEEYGILQLTQKLYNGITKGEMVVLHKDNKDEDTSPFGHIFGTREETVSLEMCIECLRKIIALREHINKLYKQCEFNRTW